MNEHLSMLIIPTMESEFLSQVCFYSNFAHHTPYFLMPRLELRSTM